MKRTLITLALGSLLLIGCSANEEPAAAPVVDPWTEICNAHCADLEALTSESFQTCGRPAGAKQAQCLDAITSKIYEIEDALPDQTHPEITEDIDTIRDTSEKYSDANCDSGRADGLAGATCTIQSITIEKRARAVFANLKSAAA